MRQVGERGPEPHQVLALVPMSDASQIGMSRDLITPTKDGQGGQSGASEASRLILDEGADPNLTDELGRPPLWLACRFADVDVAFTLLSLGARVDSIFGECGGTLLLRAVGNTSAHINVGRMLLERGASVDQADAKGLTPLMRACFARSLGFVRLLLEYGADKTAGLHGESGLLPKGSTAADIARICNEEMLARLVDIQPYDAAEVA
ncbi:MAG: hypothetical protein SGPRY_001627 [Prymnesium sp.]